MYPCMYVQEKYKSENTNTGCPDEFVKKLPNLYITQPNFVKIYTYLFSMEEVAPK
jgi:hypothetical protein